MRMPIYTRLFILYESDLNKYLTFSTSNNKMYTRLIFYAQYIICVAKKNMSHVDRLRFHDVT